MIRGLRGPIATTVVLGVLIGVGVGWATPSPADPGSPTASGQTTGSGQLTSGLATAAKKKPCRRRKSRRRCRPRHDERGQRTVQINAPNGYVPSAPEGGKSPDLLAPWQPGQTLIAGGDCGAHVGQGDHVDFEGRWNDDRFAIDFGVCGGRDHDLPVVAATGGVVRVAGFHPDYGWTVLIERSRNGLATRYAHLARRPPRGVRVGKRVAAGQPIGAIGYSGLGGVSKESSHLHFVLYGGRGRHKGLRIRRVARQVPCPNCQVLAQSFAPGTPFEPVSHYSCPGAGMPAQTFLQPGEKVVQPFLAQGQQILGGYLAINGPYNEASGSSRARVGVYAEHDSLPSYALAESSLTLPRQSTGSDSSGAAFAFDLPAATRAGTPLFLVVTAIDRVNVFRQGPQFNACVLGTLGGYR